MGYLPTTDSGLLEFCENFSDLIAGPAATGYGLTEEDVAAYATLVALFSTRLTASNRPETEGRRTVFQKNATRKSLETLTRQYAQQINRLTTVTDDERQALGLTIRSGSRTSVSAPTTSPLVVPIGTKKRNVSIEVRQSSNRRGRPAGVADAIVFTHIGPIAPTDMNQWKFAAKISKTTTELPFPPSDTGDTVWITAFWTNAKGQSGPSATPVSVNLPAGGALPQEVNEQPTMKIAA